MKLKVSINLGDYEHLGMKTKEYDDIESCVKEIVKHFSRIKHYEIDQYITSYLIPMIYDESIPIKEYKQKKDKINVLDLEIKEKNQELEGLMQDCYQYELSFRERKKALEELEEMIKNKWVRSEMSRKEIVFNLITKRTKEDYSTPLETVKRIRMFTDIEVKTILDDLERDSKIYQDKPNSYRGYYE